MLMAKQVEFIHPVTGQDMLIEAEFDEQWQQIFNVFEW
jgi:tRNA pseudouridine65 synthase